MCHIFFIDQLSENSMEETLKDCSKPTCLNFICMLLWTILSYGYIYTFKIQVFFLTGSKILYVEFFIGNFAFIPKIISQITVLFNPPPFHTENLLFAEMAYPYIFSVSAILWSQTRLNRLSTFQNLDFPNKRSLVHFLRMYNLFSEESVPCSRPIEVKVSLFFCLQFSLYQQLFCITLILTVSYL